MSYTNGLDKPTDYFNTVLYTGQEPSNKPVTVGFQPDWIWIKQRSGSEQHHIEDSVRGVENTIRSNSTDAEVDRGSNGIQSFDSNGFTAGGGDDINSNGGTFVSWNWLASNTTASNTDGSITSTVSANTTSGFSIVTYTGNGTDNATVGHGLSVTPSFALVKNRDDSDHWGVWHQSFSAHTSYNSLSQNIATINSDDIFKAFSSTLFTLGTDSWSNTNTEKYVAYLFAEKKGYSKFGSYTGNGNADGTFVYTGFKPALILIKQTNATGSWYMWDNKRDTFNPYQRYISPNNANAEYTSSERWLDSLSNGFKWKNTETAMNGSGSTYIYMAFAESPFVTSTGIPTTAR